MKIVTWRGVRGLKAAKLLTDTTEEIEYDEVRDLAGISKLSKTTETSSETKFYDNSPAVIIQGDGADEVAIDASAVSEENQAWMTGEYYDAEDDIYIEGSPEQQYYALGYIVKKSDLSERYVWRLKGSFAYPESEHNTEDDGTDSTGTTINYTGVETTHKFTKTGKTAKAVNVGAEKYDESKFFATVQTPDTYTEAKKTAE